MNHPKLKVGIIGCGNISSIYCQNGKRFDSFEIVACADIDLERAKARATEFQIPKALTVEELLADAEVKLVINLTIPAAHAQVATAALEAGKSVYNEKPLAVTREEGRALLDLAESRKLRVGCAPDTFLGGGLQTCRKLIDDGWIGEPIGASAFMLSRGPDRWHPNIEFFYEPGGGPMFDMGPYYLTALTTILGPVKRISGSTRASFPERVVLSEARFGQKVKVGVDTHIVGVLDFASGVIGSITTSFDVWSHRLPCLEIYGTHGTLGLPDPNGFGEPVMLRRGLSKDWSEIPLAFGLSENSRGIGVADMSAAIQAGIPHRANGKTAYHVLDIMHSIHDASRDGKYIELQSTMEKPEPLPMGQFHSLDFLKK